MEIIAELPLMKYCLMARYCIRQSWKICDGSVLNYYEFQDEMPLTEWYDGHIEVRLNHEGIKQAFGLKILVMMVIWKNCLNKNIRDMLSVNELEDRLIDLAFAEDIGDGDHTTLCCIPEDAVGKSHLLIKEDGILAGVRSR